MKIKIFGGAIIAFIIGLALIYRIIQLGRFTGIIGLGFLGLALFLIIMGFAERKKINQEG